MSSSLPGNWVTCSVLDLGHVITGSTPSTKKPNYYGGAVPFVRPPNLLEGTIGATDSTLTAEGAINGRTVTAGAVLVGCIGNLGKVGVASETVAFNQQINALVPYQGEFGPWFFYVVQSADFHEKMAAASSATTVTILNKGNFSKLEVPVAPLDEMRRIVETIESYLTRLDVVITALERGQRNLKRYGASVLKAAVEGRLVPTEATLARQENRVYEPSRVVLERILKERKYRFIEETAEKNRAKAEVKAKRTGKSWAESDNEKSLTAERAIAIKKYKEPVAPDTSGLSELPEGWCWASVEELGFIASGQTPKGVTTAGSPEGDIPWFRVGDMNNEGNEIHMRIVQNWLTAGQVRELGLHVRPRGTILFPKRGGAIKTNKKRLLAVPSTYDLNTMGIVPIQSVGPYLWIWFLGLDLGPIADGSNVPQLNHDDIAPLAVPLPPLDEQARIIAEVERMMSVKEASTNIVNENVLRSRRLHQSILKWAFEGRLVDQNPNDEPASTLLERIKAERVATESTKKTAGRGRMRRTP